MAIQNTNDVMSTDQRSALMGRIRGKDTLPELTLRRAAWALGLHYRVHRRINRITPDMVFVGARVAVFVDGCFWHCCPLHSVMPKNNRDFWAQKLKRNCERDAENTRQLVVEGWQVLRLWEHEIEASPANCAQRISEMLGKTGKSRA